MSSYIEQKVSAVDSSPSFRLEGLGGRWFALTFHSLQDYRITFELNADQLLELHSEIAYKWFQLSQLRTTKPNYEELSDEDF